SDGVSLAKHRRDTRPKTGRLGEDAFDLQPLLVNRGRPTPRSRPGLMTPLQQVHDQDHEATFQLPPIAAPHAFDLLGDIGGVDRRELTRAQQAALLNRPSIEIFFVVSGVAGHHTSPRLSEQVSRKATRRAALRWPMPA